MVGLEIALLSSSLFMGIEDAKNGKGQSKKLCLGHHYSCKTKVHDKIRPSMGIGQGE